MQFFIFLALGLAVMAMTFALQNPGLVAVKFLTWEFTGSLAMVLLVVFALGYCVGVLITLTTRLRKRNKEKPHPTEIRDNVPSDKQ